MLDLHLKKGKWAINSYENTVYLPQLELLTDYKLLSTEIAPLHGALRGKLKMATMWLTV